MESIAERKQIHLKIDDFPQEIYIQAQSEKIVRVLENLISNAIKFSFEKSDILIGCQKIDNKVVIFVKDEGIGIPENLRQKLFDRFTKSGRLGTLGEKSLGLGMNIVRKIVELHEGNIDIESAVGKGTTIKIILPSYKK
jgi:signal transduction histidine kinase